MLLTRGCVCNTPQVCLVEVNLHPRETPTCSSSFNVRCFLNRFKAYGIVSLFSTLLVPSMRRIKVVASCFALRWIGNVLPHIKYLLTLTINAITEKANPNCLIE